MQIVSAAGIEDEEMLTRTLTETSVSSIGRYVYLAWGVEPAAGGALLSYMGYVSLDYFERRTQIQWRGEETRGKDTFGPVVRHLREETALPTCWLGMSRDREVGLHWRSSMADVLLLSEKGTFGE